MKIILTSRVSGLGKIGDVVNVKNGYAKNFLIPNQKAICFTPNSQKLFDAKKAEFEKANEDILGLANEVKGKFLAQNLVIIENASDDGRLYGSVNSSVVAQKVNEAFGREAVEKNDIILEKPIKEIGVYSIKIDLHSDVDFTVKLVVSRLESEVEKLIKADEKAKKDAQKAKEEEIKKAKEAKAAIAEQKEEDSSEEVKSNNEDEAKAEKSEESS